MMDSWTRCLLPIILLWTLAGWTDADTGTMRCRQREGVSLAVVTDQPLKNRLEEIRILLDRISARFPCVTRQYTSVIMNQTEKGIFDTTYTDKDKDTLVNILKSWGREDAILQNCGQFRLEGVKKALELSPAESLILVYTSGSMADYTDTLQSEILALLTEKRQQVYFFVNPTRCDIHPSHKSMMTTITSRSFGEYLPMDNIDYYELLYSLELLMSKPLNSSLLILNITSDGNAKPFTVDSSIKHLLVTTDSRFDFDITDPNKKVFQFKKSSRSNPSAKKDGPFDTRLTSSSLIKNPIPGTWNLIPGGSLSLRIFGFTGPAKQDSCSDCHRDASCEEFGGNGECTCKEGFSGDGYTCKDIDECQDKYADICSWYDVGSCENTVGSYTCNCCKGYQYDQQFGCVDIDECANPSLNDCDSTARCINKFGYFTCQCPAGYTRARNGCIANSCGPRYNCNDGEECSKSDVSYNYTCMDPCINHTVLNDPWRSINNMYGSNAWNYWLHSYPNLNGWYRFKGKYSQQIPEHCVLSYRCGVAAPMWMKGRHPKDGDGIVHVKTCASWNGDCCIQSGYISVKKCSAGFYVYKIFSLPHASMDYCTESKHICSEIDCAPGEECRSVHGTLGCYCKSLSVSTSEGNSGNLEESNDGCSEIDCAPDEECRSVNGTFGCQCKPLSVSTSEGNSGNLEDVLKLQVTCEVQYITVTFSKCLLEKLRYNSSSIHLRNNSCGGVIDRSDKTYVSLVTRPQKDFCGGFHLRNRSHITHLNTVYLSNSTGGINAINFTCTYPIDKEKDIFNQIEIPGFCCTGQPKTVTDKIILMSLYQDMNYTRLYTDSEGLQSSMLYVDFSAPYNYLIIKSCYLMDEHHVKIMHFIENGCIKNETTEVGTDTNKRFSFKCPENLKEGILECKASLCHIYPNDDCSVKCPIELTTPYDMHDETYQRHIKRNVPPDSCPFERPTSPPEPSPSPPAQPGLPGTATGLITATIVILMSCALIFLVYKFRQNHQSTNHRGLSRLALNDGTTSTSIS